MSRKQKHSFCYKTLLFREFPCFSTFQLHSVCIYLQTWIFYTHLIDTVKLHQPISCCHVCCSFGPFFIITMLLVVNDMSPFPFYSVGLHPCIFCHIWSVYLVYLSHCFMFLFKLPVVCWFLLHNLSTLAGYVLSRCLLIIKILLWSDIHDKFFEKFH